MFNHTTPFSTKGLEKSLCDFTGTIFVQWENPVGDACPRLIGAAPRARNSAVSARLSQRCVPASPGNHPASLDIAQPYRMRKHTLCKFAHFFSLNNQLHV